MTPQPLRRGPDRAARGSSLLLGGPAAGRSSPGGPLTAQKRDDRAEPSRDGAAARPASLDVATRTVLMVDYCFPPMAGAGVQRTLNYVKHLGEFGWSPIVLTVKDSDASVYDASLLEGVPEAVRIERTASLEPVRSAKRSIARLARQRRRAEASRRHDGRPAWGGPRWIQDIERWVLFPDRRIGWLPFALARGIAVSHRRGIDVVYSTSTAVTSHVIAYLLAKLLKKPWVADFQDWWVEECIGPGHKWAGRRLEHLILRAADRTTFTTEPLRQMFHLKYPTVPLRKLRAIPMGFDPEAFRGIESIPRSKFTIVHFGAFYGPRSPGPFLKALAECVRAHDGLARRIEVLFFGTFDAELLRLAERLIGAGGLDRIVRLEGVIPYRAGLQQVVSADVLLLVTAPGKNGQTHIPSKLFEYLGARRPILALAPQGAAAGIVHEAGAGVVVDPTDIEGIRDAVLRLYHQWVERRLVFPVDPVVVSRYTWREVAGRFARTLEDALAQPATPRGCESRG